jgi:anhydro-N-acetylmuramic acid kinase
MSQLIKRKVIYNFRQEDLINKGQGAPLTPIFHNLLSRIISEKYQIEFPICFLNIGGISNITKIIKKDENIEENLEAFDSGPGNCMIDDWVRKNSKNSFDKNGSIAKSGKIDQLILNQSIDNFKIDSFNKSLDIKDFDILFAKGLSLEDGCATITNFTAYLIAKGIEHANGSNDKPIKYLVCGGGRKNSFLIQNIKDYLISKKNIILNSIDDYNLDGDYVESQAFGYLAIRSFLKLPISYPKTTGCEIPTVGGNLVENF